VFSAHRYAPSGHDRRRAAHGIDEPQDVFSRSAIVLDVQEKFNARFGNAAFFRACWHTPEFKLDG
jgi:hypothetical protein